MFFLNHAICKGLRKQSICRITRDFRLFSQKTWLMRPERCNLPLDHGRYNCPCRSLSVPEPRPGDGFPDYRSDGRFCVLPVPVPGPPPGGITLSRMYARRRVGRPRPGPGARTRLPVPPLRAGVQRVHRNPTAEDPAVPGRVGAW